MPELLPNYPPERHFLRDLRVTTEHLDTHRSVATAPVDEAVRNRAGGASLGFISAVVDVAAAGTSLIAVHPDWTATADLALVSRRQLIDGPMTVHARLERIGSKLIVLRAEVFDGGSEHVASGLLSFARLPRAATAASPDFVAGSLIGERRTMALIHPTPPGTLADRLGVVVVDTADGVVELARAAYIANSFGTINGGVLGVVFQMASEAMVPTMVAVDLQIHYLRQAGAGPLRTRGVVLRRAADHAVCTLEAVDAGNDDAVLALATVTLQQSWAHPGG